MPSRRAAPAHECHCGPCANTKRTTRRKQPDRFSPQRSCARYTQAAAKAADFVLTTLRQPDGRLFRTYAGGQAKLNGYLNDYAFLADGLIRLYRATGDKRWLALAEPAANAGEPRVELFAGTVEGHVATARRGEGGIGFDPVFELPDGRTTAELTEVEKDQLSHRGRAVAAALPRLGELLEGDARMPGTAEDA